MGVPSLYVWTHDSIGLGEDGPTHQPVEQLASLRAIPGLDVVRPGDANEVAAAWKVMLENHENPAGIVLTRQNIPTYARGDGEADGDTFGSAAGVAKGGYVLAEASPDGATVPAAGDPDRHRLRGPAGRRRPRGPAGRRHPHPRRVHAVRGMVQQAGRRLPRIRASRRRQGPRLRRGRPCPGLEGIRRRRRPLRRRSSTSVPPRTTSACSRSSASPPRPSPPPPRNPSPASQPDPTHASGPPPTPAARPQIVRSST